MRSFAFALLLLAGCGGVPSAEIEGAAAPASACGSQDQPCCAPAPPGSGFSTCSSGLSCDGSAYASTLAVTTNGVCGSVAGWHQACDAFARCFQPHVCMTTDGATLVCLDPIGGGLVCGHTGQRCCSEPNYAVENAAGPAIWCHVGLRCNDQGQCAP